MREPTGFGTYPHPHLRPIVAPNGRTAWRCPSCLTNGSPSHVPDSGDCREMRRERDWSRSS
jgi:hypothetical protein